MIRKGKLFFLKTGNFKSYMDGRLHTPRGILCKNDWV